MEPDDGAASPATSTSSAGATGEVGSSPSDYVGDRCQRVLGDFLLLRCLYHIALRSKTNMTPAAEVSQSIEKKRSRALNLPSWRLATSRSVAEAKITMSEDPQRVFGGRERMRSWVREDMEDLINMGLPFRLVRNAKRKFRTKGPKLLSNCLNCMSTTVKPNHQALYRKAYDGESHTGLMCSMYVLCTEFELLLVR